MYTYFVFFFSLVDWFNKNININANVNQSNCFSLVFLSNLVVPNASSAAITNEPNTSLLQIETPPLRRRSEGDAQQQPETVEREPTESPSIRRTSFDSSESKSATGNASSNNNSATGPVEMQRCRYPKCESSTPATEARKFYKSCHNCSHLYCSRECRRSHWEKHRKACLHSRVSVLCRQVLSTCKDDSDALRHLTILARHGFQTHGRGVVRILFRSPESADQFVKQGYQRIGEVSYVRWPELMPQEMGPELYSELLRLSTEYKPESKMLLYVAICVVSEAPSSAAAAVKWERQLVSRCAKLKLSKLVQCDPPTLPIHAQIVSNCSPGGNRSSVGTSNTITSTNNTSGNEIHGLTRAQQAATTISTDTPFPSSSTSSARTRKSNCDILILTFNIASREKNVLRNREIIVQNIQGHLKKRGVSLRRHYAEVFQRLTSFVEGNTDRFPPVTIHPKDTATGKVFTCIIMSHMGVADRAKLPITENEQSIETIDCSEGLPVE